MQKIFARLLFLGIVSVMVFGIWMMRDLWRPVVFQEKFDSNQMECLTSILVTDSSGEAPEKRAMAQEYIADTVLRYRGANPSVQFCDILHNSLELYPKDWKRSWTDRGRSRRVIKFSPKSTDWTEAMNRAITAVTRGARKEGCATRVVRREPGYSFFTNEVEAQKWIRQNMRKDPSVPAMNTEFYCE